MSDLELDPGESSSNPLPRRKPGRPKGSKDGPRSPNAPKRGRRRKESSQTVADWGPDISTTAVASRTDSVVTKKPSLDEFGYEKVLPPAILTGLYQLDVARGGLTDTAPSQRNNDSAVQPAQEAENRLRNNDTSRSSKPNNLNSSVNELRRAAASSRHQPFFSQQSVFSVDDESEDEEANGMGNGEDTADMARIEKEKASREIRHSANPEADAQRAWFDQPQNMPRWLYRYFVDVVGPLITSKDGNFLSRPPIFSDQQHTHGSLWMHPPEPIMSLHHYRFEPQLLYRPPIFFWLPHFFVREMRCPNCHTGVLEKNGACPPRRIVDVEDAFWIITWSYYCRKGCKSHFRGWHPAILDSLPPYLRLAFPAILS